MFRKLIHVHRLTLYVLFILDNLAPLLYFKLDCSQVDSLLFYLTKQEPFLISNRAMCYCTRKPLQISPWILKNHYFKSNQYLIRKKGRKLIEDNIIAADTGIITEQKDFIGIIQFIILISMGGCFRFMIKWMELIYISDLSVIMMSFIILFSLSFPINYYSPSDHNIMVFPYTYLKDRVEEYLVWIGKEFFF